MRRCICAEMNEERRRGESENDGGDDDEGGDTGAALLDGDVPPTMNGVGRSHVASGHSPPGAWYVAPG